ncbi:glycosyltransferase family 2 protein [Heyndrickxia sp. FSL W8-0423]|uniref:glycosyltransferase family 2 protein n=1 Tax=Heyndrickxia sp. FSL W8-0423 TaxID=2921601 RepID=UPI0030FB44C3
MQKFAIIIPVYNKERFLKETIESILNQTINFFKYIEVILVNDGSTDKSAEICQLYKNMYPNNIKYIEIENNGPSYARNLGLRMVSNDTSLIGFLDADDKYQNNSLYEVSNFFYKYKVDLAVIPIMYFTSKGEKREHNLNYRFSKGSRVIDIFKEHSAIHFYAGGVFIKKSILDKKNFNFDESIDYWEDALTLNKYFLLNPTYGVIDQTFYYYRREAVADSLVDNSWSNKKRYNILVENGYLTLVELSIKKYGVVLPYIQFLLVYHLKLFLYKRNSEKIMTNLSEIEKKNLILSIINILQYIDEDYILEQNMKHYYKEFLISLKRSGWPLKLNLLPNENGSDEIIIKKKQFIGYGIKLIGYYSSEYYTLTSKDYISIRSGKKDMICTQKHIEKDIKIWGQPVRNLEFAGFEVVLPLHRLKIEFYLNKYSGFSSKLNSFNYYERIVKKIPLLRIVKLLITFFKRRKRNSMKKNERRGIN